jgi:hypothetical protein
LEQAGDLLGGVAIPWPSTTTGVCDFLKALILFD